MSASTINTIPPWLFTPKMPGAACISHMYEGIHQPCPSVVAIGICWLEEGHPHRSNPFYRVRPIFRLILALLTYLIDFKVFAWKIRGVYPLV